MIQVTKMGLVFVFDRTTGEPVFGIEERAVPPSDVPGEQAWPTQPFPVKPPPALAHTPAHARRADDGDRGITARVRGAVRERCAAAGSTRRLAAS